MYSVVLPVLNEYENLRELLPLLAYPGSEVLICDGGSTDGSTELVGDLFPGVPVRLLRGTGTVADAILRGLKSANYDKIIVMDSDLSHDPDKVKEIVEKLDESDIVVACREDSEDGNVFRRFTSGLYNFLTYPLAPKVTDRSSGFWGIRKTLLSTKVRPSVKVLMEYVVRSRTRSISTVTYTYRNRLYGTAKLGRSLSNFVDIGCLYLAKFEKPIKYLIVGGTGIAINLSLLWALTEIVGLYYVLSSFLGILVTTVFTYIANNYWTFNSKELF